MVFEIAGRFVVSEWGELSPIVGIFLRVGTVLDSSDPWYPTPDDRFALAQKINCVVTEEESQSSPFISVDFNANPVVKVFNYSNGTDGSFLMGVSDGKLYQITANGVSFVMDLFSKEIVPAMLNYNGRMLIADGSPHIKWFDGSTIGELETSPPYATALAEIGNRVVCNSGGSGELDSVYFSGAEDDEDWDTAGNAVGIRAGYLDGMTVNALGVLGTDLLVFKGGSGGKKTYRVSTNGTPSDWYNQLLSANATALSPFAVEQIGNDLWFADDVGLKSISQVQTYGDLAMAMTGMPIESAISGKQVRELTFLPSLGVLSILVEGTADIYLYHPHNKAFTTWNIGDILINSICESGGKVYLAGGNGYLYRLGIDDIDSLVPNLNAPVQARIEGRQYIMPKDGIVRRTRVYYDELTPTTGTVGIVSPNMTTGVNEVVIANITPIDSRMLVAASEDLADANLSLARAQRGFIDSRARYRSGIFSFTVKTTKGRIQLKNLSFDAASVEG